MNKRERIERLEARLTRGYSLYARAATASLLDLARRIVGAPTGDAELDAMAGRVVTNRETHHG